MQSEGPVPEAKERHCFLETFDGNIIGQIPIPEDVVKMEVSGGGREIDFVYDAEDEYKEEYLCLNGIDPVKTEDDFFLFDTNAEYGDRFEKDYFNYLYFDEITSDPTESELKTKQIKNLDLYWKTTEYAVKGKGFLDVDGYCNIDEMSAFSFHSRGLKEDKVLDIVQTFEKGFIQCPNVRSDKVYLENDSGLECFTCLLPDHLQEFGVYDGGCAVEWQHTGDTKWYFLWTSFTDSIQEEKSTVEEYDIDNPVWEQYQGSKLVFEYTIGKLKDRSYEENEMIAITQNADNVLRIELRFEDEEEEKVKQEFFALLDQIESTQAIRTGTKSEEADQGGTGVDSEFADLGFSSDEAEKTEWETPVLPLIPDEGYCFIDDVTGHKIGQVRIPDNILETKVSLGGSRIEFINGKYRNMILEPVIDPSKEYLIDIGTSILEMEDPVCEEDRINEMNVTYIESGAKILGYMELPQGTIKFDVQGYETNEWKEVLRTIRPMSVDVPNIRENAAFIENEEGIETVQLPISDQSDVSIGQGGNEIDIYEEDMSCSVSLDSHASVEEYKQMIDSVQDSQYESMWDEYEGGSFKFVVIQYYDEFGEDEHLDAYGEYEGNVICVRASSRGIPSKINESVKERFCQILDKLTPAQ